MKPSAAFFLMTSPLAEEEEEVKTVDLNFAVLRITGESLLLGLEKCYEFCFE